MEITRRDMLKVTGLGVLGTATAFGAPWAGTVAGQSASLLDPTMLPQPFRTGFVRPPRMRPYRSARDADGVWTDYFTVTERASIAHIVLPRC